MVTVNATELLSQPYIGFRGKNANHFKMAIIAKEPSLQVVKKQVVDSETVVGKPFHGLPDPTKYGTIVRLSIRTSEKSAYMSQVSEN